MSRTLVVVLALCLIQAQAQGQAEEKLADTGGAFLTTCGVIEKPTKQMTPTELLDANYCSAYLSGFLESLRFTSELSQDPIVCLPDTGIDPRAAIKLVSSYIRQSPERKRRLTAVLVGNALRLAFPCSQ